MTTTNGKKHSTGYDSNQAVNARIARRTDSWFSDMPRDLPLLVGYEQGPGLIAELGLAPANQRLASVMGSVALSAVVAARMDRGVSFSLNHNHYTGLYRRYHDTLRLSLISKAVAQLEFLGLVEVERGRTWADGGQGKQSRLWATPLLLERVGGRYIERPRSKEIIRLFDEYGRLITYDENAETRRMRASLRDWNDDLSGRKIDFTDPRVIRLENGLALLPTKDDDGEYSVRLDTVDAYRRFKGDFTQVGRFFGPGYQSVSKAVRSTIEIDGAPTASADFANSHVIQAYGVVGVDPGEGDAYTGCGLPEEKRPRTKVFTNVALNCGDRVQAVNTIAWELAKADRIAECGREDGARAGPNERGEAHRYLSAIEERHRPIASLFYSGAGIRFMKVEADIIEGTASEARRYGIPVLGIHDEVIVPADKIEIVADIMAAEWAKRISVQAIVRT